ncbi:5-formyltetrahydrofolate cyclo-ligase [Gluconacetobacter tumulisoli]|uniref:5-formyltetrahydrofolate cyclo-ligase n=1 Tax=Gluconacetobacter tumulisoli TaxID=1286189 RepID=A0A7W4K9A4_9PROT|nr:5-formyltetrahydrofolate cyclo-ligase [Gluconacetobacter tumulisoli]MBB2202665.1 5-formyltetrahydrofolate cyclo-ligase [Gluconacetobacter tumulisoli]
MAAPHTSPPDSDSPLLAAAKADLRRRLMAARARPAADHVTEALCRRMLASVHDAVPAGAAVAAVWPLPGEIDLRALCARLHGHGYRVLLPETPPRGHPLRFRLWQPGGRMVPGRFGTAHPDGPAGRPDFVFVPLLAFDRRGFRLGYGGGYYDRTLAGLGPVPATGYGLAAQEVPEVPTGRHDIPLPVVVTERETIRCGT